VGRHSSPNSAPRAVPRRALVAGGAALAALAIAVIAVLALQGGDDTTTAKSASSASNGTSADGSGSSSSATPTDSSSTSASTTASTSASTTASPAASRSASPSPTERPRTLDLRLTGDSYVMVRVPGGQTLLTKVLHKGDHRSFDQKSLVVVLGNAVAVEVRVNGKLLPRGGRGQVASFVAKRK
jgi:hypothetical protein